MRSFEQLQRDLNELRAAGRSYQEIADRYNVSKGLIWKIINRGYLPASFELKRKLDLPDERSVQFVMVGNLPGDHYQIKALEALVCKCGQAFVPNHPRRVHCFTCSPYTPSI